MPDIVYQGPLYITTGGTYTGNYKSDDPNTPAILVFCYDPVNIIGCNISHAGNGIQAYGGSKLTIRQCSFFGQAPQNNNQWGRALNVYHHQTFVFEHNEINHSGGIILDHSDENTISAYIRYNKFINTDKRRTDNSEGDHRAAILFNTIDSPQGMIGEIAWNYFYNELGNSWIEDNINLGNFVGKASAPFEIHDNYIKGAYPYNTNTDHYTGSGITVEGEPGHNQASNVSQWINIYNNQVISVCNGGININAGHDIHAYGNTIISSGMFPNGVQSNLFWGGCAIWNGSNVPYPSVFHDIAISGNTIGYVRPGVNVPYANRQDYVVVNDSPISVQPGDNTHLQNPITLQTELDQLTIWEAKLAANNKVVGLGENGQEPITTTTTTSTSTTTTSTSSSTTTTSTTVGTTTTSTTTIIMADTIQMGKTGTLKFTPINSEGKNVGFQSGSVSVTGNNTSIFTAVVSSTNQRIINITPTGVGTSTAILHYRTVSGNTTIDEPFTLTVIAAPAANNEAVATTKIFSVNP